MGYDPLSLQTEQYTVSAVVGEVKDRSTRIRIQTAIDAGVLRIMEPTKESRNRVIIQSMQLGDMDKLSAADLDVLALTLDLTSSGQKCLLITDDYAVQNIANPLKISFKSLVAHGIRYQFIWRLHCPACGRTYHPNFREKACPVCGTILRRKVVKKKKVE
ncbi:hypothetical protein MUP77_16195 [Candidatus Bathyarchaeota archaeon]|nr:hypothetical protein [Candidatus Bathyarchaeota archaeon]